MLEDTTNVGFHVTLSRARRSLCGGNRVGARFGQHDARRVTQSIAKTHAIARTAAIRRHNYHYGDDLGHGSLAR